MDRCHRIQVDLSDDETALLGVVRAGLLVALETPASSTELASRLGVTPTAVNQHLRALRDGGLLVGVRDGRSVLYRRSPLGDRLVAPDPTAWPD